MPILVTIQERVLVWYPLSFNLRWLTSITDNPIELDIASDRHSSRHLYNCHTDDVEENPAQTENLIDGKELRINLPS